MAYNQDDSQTDKDVHVRDHFDRMTRAYLRSVLSDEVIEEHRSGDVGHPSEPLWRLLNMVRGASWSELGNTPGHLNHWSKRSFVRLLSRHGDIAEVRSPFPWTMALVRI